MFTKCPSCHTEISFEPPSNAPAGYKHRIKCPNASCGVTISVALPTKQVVAPAPVGTQVGNPALTPGETAPSNAALEAGVSSGKVRYKGRARSVFMFILSLLLVAICIVPYLIGKGIIPATVASISLAPLASYDVITIGTAIAKDFSGFFANISQPTNYFMLVPIAYALFVLIMFISNFIGIFAGKYGKTGNVIFSLLAFLATIGILLSDYRFPVEFGAYIQALIKFSLVTVIVAGLALLVFIITIILAAVKKKAKEPKIA